jgi:hypothetical protein
MAAEDRLVPVLGCAVGTDFHRGLTSNFLFRYTDSTILPLVIGLNEHLYGSVG